MGRENIQQLKIGISSMLWGEYMVCKKIGEGGFGSVFEVMKLNNPSDRYALKAEPLGVEKSEEFLKMERRCMNLLTKHKALHCTNIIGAGKHDNYNYLIMGLLGPSLSDLRKALCDNKIVPSVTDNTPAKKFTLYTVCVVAIQALDGLRELHDVGFIHRDVKPSNFAVGRMDTPDRKWVYILDFGLCRQYVWENPQPNKKVVKVGAKYLRERRKQAPIRGTMRYCSSAVHRREEQGRQDDLWSHWYMMVEMHNGELPWSKKDKMETEKLKMESMDDLIKTVPNEFCLITKHLNILTYKCEPDYVLLRNLWCQLFKKNNFDLNMPLDWEPTAKDGALCKSMHHYTVIKHSKVKLDRRFKIEAPAEEIDVKTISNRDKDDSNSGQSDNDDTLDELGDLATKSAKNVKKKDSKT